MEPMLGNILALYSKYGIRSITMDDLSRELGVSKKTIYQHVKDKTELVSLTLDLEMKLNREFMEESRGGSLNAIEELIQVNRKIHAMVSSHNPAFYYDLKKYYPSIFRTWMDDRRQRMYKMLVDNITRGKSEDLYRDDLDEEVIARLHMAIMEMLYENELLTKADLASAHFLREILVYHLHGICKEEGLDYLKTRKELV
jgi:AcrR family transcriptional regulator